MAFGKLFLSAQGRIGRRAYLVGVCSLFALIFTIGLLAGLSLGAESEAASLITSVLTIALVYPLICVNTKRLHDLGHTGWWQILANIVTVIFDKLIAPMLLAGPAAGWASLLLYLAFYGGLAAAPGKAGRNEYGEPPGRKSALEAAEAFE